MGNLINLTKTAGIVLEKKQLTGVKAQVVLAIDKSGSMATEFGDGTVQEVVDRILGIGMNMDVDKSIDMYTFNRQGQSVGSVTEGNHSNFVRANGLYASGGTDYAPVMKMIADATTKVKKKSLFSFGKKAPSTEPVYPTLVIFITDGDNYDKGEAEKFIKDVSNQPIFWQFVGIGGAGFDFLDKLDKMPGRHVDNANFFKIPNIAKVTDEWLYEQLLTEFPSWLREIKAKGMI